MATHETLAAGASIFMPLALFLCLGVISSTLLKSTGTTEYVSANRTQTWLPLALNFIASLLGTSIFFVYPQITVIAGVQGLLTYVFASTFPLITFGLIGPVVRRKCPDGFVFSEWVLQRYGRATGLTFSFFTIVTLLLYLVAELTALYGIVSTLTQLNPVVVVCITCAIITIYSCIGGIRVSIFTDNIQVLLILTIIFVAIIAISLNVKVDSSLIKPSGLLKSSQLGWQLLYILPVAIVTNDLFLSGVWLRTFASRDDRHLLIGVCFAMAIIFLILMVVGTTGLLAAWSGIIEPHKIKGSDIVFLTLLQKLPYWTVCLVLILVISLSCAASDGLLTAIIASCSNDIFRNRLPINVVRLILVVLMIPVTIIALRAPDILSIFLISDLISACIVPPTLIGLFDRPVSKRIAGIDVLVGTLGGFLCIFFFGLAYFSGNAKHAAGLLIIKSGLYVNDWSVFGAFVAAPVGSLIFTAASCTLRHLLQLAPSSSSSSSTRLPIQANNSDTDLVK